MLYLIKFGSEIWCSCDATCVVKAPGPEEALDIATPWMNDIIAESLRELDEDLGVDVYSVEEFGPNHRDWVYFLDEEQRVNEFPCVNFSDDDIGFYTSQSPN